MLCLNDGAWSPPREWLTDCSDCCLLTWKASLELAGISTGVSYWLMWSADWYYQWGCSAAVRLLSLQWFMSTHWWGAELLLPISHIWCVRRTPAFIHLHIIDRAFVIFKKHYFLSEPLTLQLVFFFILKYWILYCDCTVSLLCEVKMFMFKNFFIL